MIKEVLFWFVNFLEDIIIVGFYLGVVYLIDRVFVFRSEFN